MANIFESYFRDEEEDELTPSQEAAEKVQPDKQKPEVSDNIFSSYFKEEPKPEPAPTPEPEPQEEKGFIGRTFDSISDRFKRFQKDVSGVTPEMVGEEIREAPQRVKDFFSEPEAPDMKQVIVGKSGEEHTVEELFLAQVKKSKTIGSDIDNTKNDLVEEYLKEVKDNPRLLRKDRPMSGAAQFISPKEWKRLENLVRESSDDELREIIKQKLERNNYQILSVTDQGRGERFINDNIKELTKQYNTQVKTKGFLDETVNKGTADGNFREGIKEGWSIPFVTSIDNTIELIDFYKASQKSNSGKPLSDYEQSLMEKASAEEIENILDPKGIGYTVSRIFAEAPAFIVEYATTKGITTGVSKSIQALPVMEKIATKAPIISKLVGFLGGTTVTTATGFLPRVVESTMTFSTDNREFVFSEEGDILMRELDTDQDLEDAFVQNLPKGFADTWLEVASESAGEGVQYAKKGIMAKFFAKHADEGVDATATLAKELGWNGIVGEVFEEEIIAPPQAALRDEEYKAPLVTKEGNVRLLTEFAAFGIMNTVMTAPVNTYNKVQMNKAKKEMYRRADEAGIPREEVDTAIEIMQEAAEQQEGLETAAPSEIDRPAPVEQEKKEEPKEPSPVEAIIEADLKDQGLESTDEAFTAQDIRNYQQTVGEAGETGGRTLTDRTVDNLSENPIGVEELSFDEDGNITLYRKGEVSEGRPSSFSIEQGKDQQPFEISKENILVNTTSQEMKDLLREVYEDTKFSDGTSVVDQYIKDVDNWKRLESEVIAIPEGVETQVGEEIDIGEVEAPEPLTIERVSQLSVEDRIDRAKDLAIVSFRNELPRVPAQDAELMKLLDGVEDTQERNNIMRSWLDSYDAVADQEARKVLEEPTEPIEKPEPVQPQERGQREIGKGIDQIAKEDATSVKYEVETKHGKGTQLEDLTAARIEKTIPTHAIVKYSDKIGKKFGRKTKAVSYKQLRDRSVFLYGGVSRNVFTDGYMVILDPSVADDVNEANIERFRRRSIREYKKDGFSHDEATAKTEEDIENGIKETEENYPPIEEVIPETADMEKAEIVGLTVDQENTPEYILKSDNHIILADANKFEFVRKKLPDDNFYIKDEVTPIVFSKRTKQNALVMPIKDSDPEGITVRVQQAYAEPTVEPDPEKNKVPSVNPSSQADLGDSYASLDELKKIYGGLPSVEFPELVKIARELTENPIKVKIPRKRHGSTPRGVARTSGENKNIILNPNIFKSSELMGKVLAHELGHIADYVPDNTAARGNLLGKIASLKKFLRHTFTDLETEAELDELVREQKSLQQQRRDLKEDGTVPESNKDEDAKLLKKLKKVNKKIKKLREDPSLENEKVYEELKNLTQLWKPFDESIDEGYTNYRYSNNELYADAISVLFNMPNLLEEVAPNFYSGFFENLDQKPKARDLFYETWNLIHRGEDAVNSERHKQIREMFEKGEDIHKSLLEEKRQRSKEYVFRLKYELIDKNQRVIDKINEAREKGEAIPADKNPQYWLEGHNYVGGIVKNYMEDNIQPLYEKVQNNGLTWEDVGEVLFLERVVKERGDITNPIKYLEKLSPMWDSIKDRIPEGMENKSTGDQLKFLEKEFGDKVDIETGKTMYDDLIAFMPKGLANPLGTTSKSAQQSLDYLRSELGDHKWNILMGVIEDFRKATDLVTQMGKEEGFWKEDLIKDMEANEGYATFQVLDYLKEYVPASISHQVGTLKEIANPADSTTLKSVSIIRAIERNKVKKKIVGFMKEHFPDEIKEARYTFTGKRRIPLEPKGNELALFTTIEDGSLKGYYIDPYMAKTMEYTGTGEAHAVLEVFKLFNNKLFRPMFITFNIGFQSFNLFRDFFRFYKNIENMTIPRALKAYAKALKPAAKSAWGIKDETISEMEKNKMLGITYNDVIRGATSEDARIDVILAKTGVSALEGKKGGKIREGLKTILDQIEKTGNFIETIPKVAGYQELQGTMPTQELAQTIRTKVGSPDFMRKGASYKTYNEVFLFSNAIKEGIRSDLEVATDPNTAGGYWFKTAKLNIVPKLLMWAALSGLLGDKLKDMFEDVSEYDMTNYTIIPLGEDDTGKTIYLRIPQDEMGRIIGGIFWKMMRVANNNRPAVQDLRDVLSFTGGQLPGINPLVTSVSSAAQYLAGKNPYDYFRGRPVIPDKEFEAGGMYSLKPFVNWQLKTLGVGNMWRGYVSQQAPDTKTWVQKMVEAPILSNIIGRWIKVSDYGKSEKNQQIIKNEERRNARRLLEERRKLEDAVSEYQDGSPSYTRRTSIERQLIKDVVGDPPYSGTRKAKATRTKKKFRIAIVKGTADANVTSLIYSNTNSEKLALLKEIKKDMSPAEFRDLKGRLLESKIVSERVFRDLKKESR